MKVAYVCGGGGEMWAFASKSLPLNGQGVENAKAPAPDKYAKTKFQVACRKIVKNW